MALEFLSLISETVRGLFRHDRTTRAAGVEFWVMSSTALLLLRYAVGSMGPRFMATSRHIKPGTQLLRILSHYSVSYTLGLMEPSSSEQSSALKDLFQIWAVLIVTLQASVSLGRPYKPQEMSMVDLLTSLWSANQLRAQTATHLKVPLWTIWSIHASRIIWYYLSSHDASNAGTDNMKLVSDYMASTQHTTKDPNPATMKGYKYLVLGEDRQDKQIERPSFNFKLEQHKKKKRREEFITLERVWSHTDDTLLGVAADGDNRFKDVCLSFALYKLLRRRFFDFPIPEAKHAATRRLVFEAILEDKNNYERAFRVTEVELSFLQDFSYSKHAVVFANGFPLPRVILSLLMTSAASYLAYAVRHIPNATTAVTASGRVARITHGVFITRLIIAVIIWRELWEICVFVFSQWTKVLIICHYIRLQKRGEGWMMWVLKAPQRLMMRLVARIMFPLVWRGRWDQRIHQYNLLLSAARDQSQIGGKLIPRCPRMVKLDAKVKRAMFEPLKLYPRSLWSQFKQTRAEEKPRIKSLFTQSDGVSLDSLGSYFERAFGTSSRVEEFGIKLLLGQLGGLKGDTHKILAWHVATTLCQIKLLLLEEEAGRRPRCDMYTLLPKADVCIPIPSCCPSKPSDDDKDPGVWPHYVTVGSLSNYCAYLVTKALVPETGLVVSKVFDAVRREARHAVKGSSTPSEIYKRLIAEAEPDGKEDSSIVNIGARLSEHLTSTYGADKVELWERLAKFWAGFLLHLSANTTAAKHQVHLQGSRGELTTHLWALLSHAGFLGVAAHGQQMLDPYDLNDASLT